MLYANTKTEKIFESKNSELQGIILNKPNLKRGIPIMQALEKRQSTCFRKKTVHQAIFFKRTFSTRYI